MPKSILARKIQFSCARRLYLEDKSEEENQSLFGKWTSRFGTGNNFILEASVQGELTAESGMIISIHDLNEVLKSSICDLDGRFLNEEVTEFKDTLPTTENIATLLFQRIESQLPKNVKLEKIRLNDSEQSWIEIESGD